MTQYADTNETKRILGVSSVYGLNEMEARGAILTCRVDGIGRKLYNIDSYYNRHKRLDRKKRY